MCSAESVARVKQVSVTVIVHVVPVWYQNLNEARADRRDFNQFKSAMIQ